MKKISGYIQNVGLYAHFQFLFKFNIFFTCVVKNILYFKSRLPLELWTWCDLQKKMWYHTQQAEFTKVNMDATHMWIASEICAIRVDYINICSACFLQCFHLNLPFVSYFEAALCFWNRIFKVQSNQHERLRISNNFFKFIYLQKSNFLRFLSHKICHQNRLLTKATTIENLSANCETFMKADWVNLIQ